MRGIERGRNHAPIVRWAGRIALDGARPSARVLNRQVVAVLRSLVSAYIGAAITIGV